MFGFFASDAITRCAWRCVVLSSLVLLLPGCEFTDQSSAKARIAALGGKLEVLGDGSIVVRGEQNFGNGECWRDADIAAAMPVLLGLPTLTTLDLNWTDLTDVGMNDVSKLRSLRKLSCNDSAQLTDASLSHLSSLTQLQELTLGSDQIHGTTLGELPKSLRVLKFPWSSVNDIAIARCVAFRELVHLDVSGSDITDVGMEHIAKLPKLRVLEIGGTRVTSEGVLLLRQSKTLQELNVIGTLVFTDGADELRRHLPHLAIKGADHNDLDRERLEKKWSDAHRRE